MLWKTRSKRVLLTFILNLYLEITVTDALTELGSAKSDDVNREIKRQWSLLLNDKDTRKLAEARGVDLTVIDDLGQEPPVVAAPKEEGNRADVMTAILIKVGSAVATAVVMEALKKAWKLMIEPQIKKRFSTDKEPPVAGS
ncbi:MAG: hypothetical protein R8G34_17800 [Paracoccaceae bacterium]|nr:hypothetical protein [Paracoccaceae bacterium]